MKWFYAFLGPERRHMLRLKTRAKNPGGRSAATATTTGATITTQLLRDARCHHHQANYDCLSTASPPARCEQCGPASRGFAGLRDLQHMGYPVVWLLAVALRSSGESPKPSGPRRPRQPQPLSSRQVRSGYGSVYQQANKQPITN